MGSSSNTETLRRAMDILDAMWEYTKKYTQFILRLRKNLKGEHIYT